MSGTIIGDLSIPIRATLDSFRQDVAKEAEASGKAGGKRFGDIFSVAAKLGSGAASGALGIATKGLLELDTATAKYRAETNATAEDVKKAQAAILESNKTQRQGIAELGEGLSALRTQMGLSQDDANKLLDPFAQFATVTGQTIPAAVGAFDDILDAWNLTADDATGIMDKLVVSHQKYGTSVADTQSALAGLAPAMTAANLTIDDGISVLNLFASKGIDAETATAAFTKALTKVESPAELQAAIADISKTTDAMERAQKAADLFGAKAGAKLGAALAGANLDDFKISMDEATGATKRAADALNSDITSRARQAIKALAGEITQMAAPAGPVITGFGSVATGAKAMGLSFDAAGGKAKTLKKLMAGGFVATVALVGFEILQDAIARLETFDKRVKEIEASSDSAYTKMQAFIQASRDAESPINQWYLELTGQDRVSAINRWAESLTAAQRIQLGIVPTMQDLGDAAASSIPLVGLLGDAWGTLSGKLQEALGPERLEGYGTDVEESMTRLRNAFGAVPDAALDAGKKTPRAFAQGIITTRQEPLDAFTALVEALKHPLSQTAETARLIGELTGKEMAKGLASADPEIRAKAATARQSILDRLEAITPRAGTISKEAMDALAKGMTSKDAIVRGAATGIYQTIEAQLALKDAKLWAQHAADAYAEGFASKQEYLAEKTRTFLAGASRQLIAASPPKEGPLHEIDVWGKKTGLAWIDGFIESMDTAPKRISDVLAGIKAMLADYTPVSAFLPAASPEAQRTALQGYIAELTGRLAHTTDPAERNRIEGQIATYTQRMTELIGKVGTADEKAIDALRGYIGHLDKALLTETDPKRQQQILDEITAYRIRIDALLARGNASSDGPYTSQYDAAARGGVEAAVAYAAAHPGEGVTLAPAPATYTPTVASGPTTTVGGDPRLQGIPGAYIDESGTLITPGFNGNYTGQGTTLPTGQRNPDYAKRGHTFNIYNPEREPASTSVRRNLQSVAAWGYDD